MTAAGAAELMHRLRVKARPGGLLACPHVAFSKGERAWTCPLWDLDAPTLRSGGPDYRIGFLCPGCADAYRRATGRVGA